MPDGRCHDRVRNRATPWTDDESIAAVPVAGRKVENELFSERFRGRKVADSERLHDVNAEITSHKPTSEGWI